MLVPSRISPVSIGAGKPALSLRECAPPRRPRSGKRAPYLTASFAGVGNITWTPAPGSDTFRFAPGHGHDTVNGNWGDSVGREQFGAPEKIDLSGFGSQAPTWGEVASNLSVVSATSSGGTVAPSVQLDLSDFGGGSITFWNEYISNIDASDFIGLSATAPPPTPPPAPPTPPTPPPSTGHNPVFGTPTADDLFGTNGPDVLSGGAGFDVVRGGGGDDILIGGPDGSTLFGQADADVFVFSGGQNWFMDFDAGAGDRIAGVDAAYIRANGQTKAVGDHLALYFGENPWDAEGAGTIWLANTSALPTGD